MLAALKFILPVGLGLGLVGLATSTKKANAATLPPGGGPSPLPASGKMTPEQAVAKMREAIASADPKVLNAVADELQANGFPDAAKDLRGVAADLARVGAAAAGAPKPVPPSPAAATPPAAMPVASPASPEVAKVPAPNPAPAAVPPIVLPGMTVVAPQPVSPVVANAARENVQRLVIHLQSRKKGTENRDQVAQLQTQEKALGHYESFDPMKRGQPGSVDGLYGPGTAWAIAKFYGIVPPNPMYWPKNWSPALTEYKRRLNELAAADPARAEEWRQAAARAKV